MKKAATSVRAFLAVAAMAAYTLAIFVPHVGEDGVRLMKDILMVVVGFYFGQSATGKERKTA